jgi:aspartyl-tRNA(Asn)/glutamyl-tRNA(Gln) amidotransferase subunit C
MAISLDDVRHIASLARLGLTEARGQSLVGELNTILGHMDVLSKVDTNGIDPVVGVGAAGAPLRSDEGPQIPLARPIASIAPSVRDGFFLVPRLSTHEDADAS